MEQESSARCRPAPVIDCPLADFASGPRSMVLVTKVAAAAPLSLARNVRRLVPAGGIRPRFFLPKRRSKKGLASLIEVSCLQEITRAIPRRMPHLPPLSKSSGPTSESRVKRSLQKEDDWALGRSQAKFRSPELTALQRAGRRFYQSWPLF